MKRWRRLIILVTLITCIILCSCTPKAAKSYPDAETFEMALNQGEDTTGDEVTFAVKEVSPNSRFGYCVRAGEHLNFSMKEDNGITEGDIVTVKVHKVEKYGPSWVINQDDYAQPTVSKNESKAESDAKDEEDYPILVVQKADAFIKSRYDNNDEMVTFHFVGEVTNLSEKKIAQFPKLTMTVKNSSGEVLATSDATGTIIMPMDSVILTGTISVPKANGWKESRVHFSADCSDFVEESFFYKPVRTDEFEFKNISSNSGNQSYVAGEVTNNSTENLSMVCVTMVLEKDNEFVWAENTYVDINSGQTKAFQFQKYGKWPEYDDIKMSVSSAM